MEAWKMWKRGFDAWEQATATLMEQVVQSPAVLGPAGAMMSAAMRAKASADRQAATLWGQAGVAVKRDQERTLHAVNQLGSRLLDLQEQLAAQHELLAAQNQQLVAQGSEIVALRAALDAATSKPARKTTRKKKTTER